jgi:hypothetical protein
MNKKITIIVDESWAKLIDFCREVMPFGTATITIQAGNPVIIKDQVKSPVEGEFVRVTKISGEKGG